MSGPSFTSIETARLRLRRFRADDAAAFAAYRADPEVARFQGWEAGYPLEAAERFVGEMAAAEPWEAGGWFQIAIADTVTDALLGDCVMHPLHEEPSVVEIGYTLDPSGQGRGYATEAVAALIAFVFADPDVARVRAITDARNLASIKVAERLEMRRVDTVHTTFKNERCVEYTYELARA